MLAGEVGLRGSTQAARMAEDTSAALDVLRKSISFDVHSHGGSAGIASKVSPSGDLASAMRAGSLAVACLADVPDWPVLGRNAEGRLLWCARRRPANFTVTTSTASPGWTN
jgi:membrane dipeptidase